MNLRLGKLISCMLIAAIAIFTLCACQPKSANSQAIQESESENLPELKIGIDILKPFVYTDKDGSYAGIDADAATEACKRAGFKPVFVEISWSDRDTYLEDGTVDCLWTAFAMDGREDNYLWTNSYLSSKEAFLVEERCPSQTIEDFNGPGGIAVRANSKAEDLVLSASSPFPSNKINSYGTFDMAKTAFVKAYADGLIGHRIVLEQIQNEYPGIYRFLSDDLETLHLGVAFAKGEEEQRDAIDNALTSMKEDGSLSAIVAAYDANAPSVEVPDEAE